MWPYKNPVSFIAGTAISRAVRRGITLLAALLFCCCLPAVAGEAGETPDADPEKPAVATEPATRPATNKRSKDLGEGFSEDKSTSGAYVMQLVMSLVVVLLAIAVLAWLMKSLNRLPKRAAGNMRVLGAMALGARERAVLVQVGETQMLLGISPGRVNTLHVFAEPVVDANSAAAQGGAATAGFASILGSLGKGGGRS